MNILLGIKFFTVNWVTDELETGLFRLGAVRQFEETISTDDRPPDIIPVDLFSTDVKLDITGASLAGRTFTSPNKYRVVTLEKFYFINYLPMDASKPQAIDIKANIQHIVSPHPEEKDRDKGSEKTTPGLRIGTTNKDSLYVGIKTPQRVIHPQAHSDYYLYNLTGSIHSNGIRRFTDFTFDFQGRHKKYIPMVDEPATIYVLGIGLLGLILTRLKKLRK